MNKLMAVIVLVALGVWAISFMDGPETLAPVKIPEKESTWVKTEKVRLTKDALSGSQKTLAQIPVNGELKSLLMTVKAEAAGQAVTDSASCLKRLAPLDLKRTAVQKAGGVWHVFEARSDMRPYSHLGMQVDSKTNKAVFALRHLCETAQGIPMDGLASYVLGEIDAKGREETLRELFDLEKNPGVVEVWVDYAETAKKNEKRVVDFAEIDKLISKAEPLIDFYAELSRRKVDAAAVNSFLSDAVTLQDVLDQFLSQDKYMVMALQEDEAIPAFEFEGEM